LIGLNHTIVKQQCRGDYQTKVGYLWGII